MSDKELDGALQPDLNLHGYKGLYVPSMVEAPEFLGPGRNAVVSVVESWANDLYGDMPPTDEKRWHLRDQTGKVVV